MNKISLHVLALTLMLSACSKKKAKEVVADQPADTTITQTIELPDTLTLSETSKLSADDLKKYGIKNIKADEVKGLEVFALKGNIKLLDTLQKSKVSILLFDEKGKFVSKTPIGKNGSVLLQNIKPNNYVVVLSRPKYRSQNDLSILKNEKQALIRTKLEHEDAYAIGNYITDADTKNRLFAIVEKDSLIAKKAANITGVSKANTVFILVSKNGKVLAISNANKKGTFQFNSLVPEEHSVITHPSSPLSKGSVKYIPNTGHEGLVLLTIGQKLSAKELAYNTVAEITHDKLLDGEIYGTLLEKRTRNFAKNETVWLADQHGTIIKKEQSRGDGNIDFKNLSEQTYYILASKGQEDFKFELAAKHTTGNSTAQGLYDRAVKKVAQNDFQGATKLIDKALELNPNFYEAYMLKGQIEENASRYTEALYNYGKALEVKPGDITAMYKQAVVKNELQQYASALSDLDKVINLDPKFSQAYFHRGVSKNNLDMHPQAIRDYQKMVELDSKAIDGYFNMGSSYFEIKQYDEAVEEYEKALKLDSLDSETYLHKGLSYQLQGKNTLAITDYNKAIELNNNLEAYLHKAEILENEHAYEGLESLYSSAIQAHPTKSEPFYHRAIFFTNRKKFDEAILDFSQAINLNNQIGYYYADRAKVYLKKKMKNESCLDISKAKELGHPVEGKLIKKACD